MKNRFSKLFAALCFSILITLAFTSVQASAADTVQRKNARLTIENNKMIVKWSAVSDADGYYVYVQKCSGPAFLTKPTVVAKAGKTSVTLSRLNNQPISMKKSYKAKVQAYKLVKGKKQIIAESYPMHAVGPQSATLTNPKAVVVENTSVTLTKGKTSQISAKVTKASSKKNLCTTGHGTREIRYYSTNTEVAKVSAKGLITAVAAGKCYVYAVAPNGIYAKIAVKVTLPTYTVTFHWTGSISENYQGRIFTKYEEPKMEALSITSGLDKTSSLGTLSNEVIDNQLVVTEGTNLTVYFTPLMTEETEKKIAEQSDELAVYDLRRSIIGFAFYQSAGADWPTEEPSTILYYDDNPEKIHFAGCINVPSLDGDEYDLQEIEACQYDISNITEDLDVYVFVSSNSPT